MKQEQVRLAHFLSFLQQRMLPSSLLDAHTPVTAAGSTTCAINNNNIVNMLNMMAKSTGTQKNVDKTTFILDVILMV